MEKRLIDAVAYCRELILERDYPGRTQEFMDAIEVAIADLGDMATVDAVEVVRCKNCIDSRPLNRDDVIENRYVEGCVWCMAHGKGMLEDEFCSSGERRRE